MKTATCTCGQLAINTSGPSESTTGSNFQNPISCSANLIYFHNDNIDCTQGDAVCTTRCHQNQTTNYYHCPECLSELFAVPQDKPSIIAIFGNYFHRAASLA